jgi:hypothetical protein
METLTEYGEGLRFRRMPEIIRSAIAGNGEDIATCLRIARLRAGYADQFSLGDDGIKARREAHARRMKGISND